MKYAWEAEYGGERIYIEVVDAPAFDAIVKSFFWGLLGRPKTNAIMVYGRELVAKREVKESIGTGPPEFDLVGVANLEDGSNAHFHAVVTPKFAGLKCRLSIDGNEIPLSELS